MERKVGEMGKTIDLVKSMFAFITNTKTYFIDSKNDIAMQKLYSEEITENNLKEIKKYKYNEKFINYNESGEIDGK